MLCATKPPTVRWINFAELDRATSNADFNLIFWNTASAESVLAAEVVADTVPMATGITIACTGSNSHQVTAEMFA